MQTILSFHLRIAQNWLILTLLSLPFFLRADGVVNNNAGTWCDDFHDTLGIFDSDNLTFNVLAGSVSLGGGSPSGYQTTVIIAPPAFDAWKEICLDANYSNPGDLLIEVLDLSNNVLFASNPDPSGCIDISSIPVSENEVRVRISHTSGTTAPTVNNLCVTWNPVTLLLFDKQGPPTIQSGEAFTYNVRLSANFVDAQDLVIWDVLPLHARGSVINPPGEDYGQDDSPVFQSASDGGIYTPVATTVNGVAVPAHSVYWTEDLIQAGVSLIYQISMRAPNGTLNGTMYENNAEVVVANGEDKTANTVVTEVLSTPKPRLIKESSTLTEGSGIYGPINTTNYALNASTITFVIRDPYGAPDGNDYTGTGDERMYNTVLYDNISDILPELIGPPAPGDISGGGVYWPGPGPTTVDGQTVPAESIYWSLGTFEPGDTFNESFSVTLSNHSGNPAGVYGPWENVAVIDSDQTNPIQDQIDFVIGIPGPGGCICKAGYFPTYPGDEQDNNCTVADGTVPVLYDDPVQYRMTFRNCGGSMLHDMLVFDRVPDEVILQGASMPTNYNGTIFYSTIAGFDDPTVHPPFDTNSYTSDNLSWSQTPPVDLSTVTWIAYYIPQISSIFFPPADPASTVTVNMDVIIPEPPMPCDGLTVTNWAIWKVHGQTDITDAYSDISPPLTFVDEDITIAAPPKGIFDVDLTKASITPATVFLPGQSTYKLRVVNEDRNSGNTLTNVQLTIQVSPIYINGVASYPSLLNISGGTLTSLNPATGTFNLDLGLMFVGDERNITMEFDFPRGIVDGSSYTILASLLGTGDQCEPDDIIVSANGTVSAVPELQVFKEDPVHIVDSGSTIEYLLKYRNIGDAPSINTWVVDRIPQHTSFEFATGPNGERVWFTDLLPPDVPAAVSVLYPVDFSVISSSFVPGIHNDGGTPGDPSDDTWTSPFGDQTTWIAFEADQLDLVPPQVPISPFLEVRFTVRNDDDGPGASTDGSPAGTIIFNEPAIFGDLNLMAIGNEVRTLIRETPGFVIDKVGNKDIVAAGEAFEWYIDYYNNSETEDDIVTIIDTIPAGVIVDQVLHEFNSVAVTGTPPATAGLQDITANPALTITPNVDGTTTLTLRISDTLRGGDLFTLEGGRITVRAHADSWVPSNMLLINTVTGIASNPTEVVVDIDEDIVQVLNADLFANKLAFPADPRPGDEVTFTLLLANRGLHPAENVVITDQLPSNMTYVPGSTLMLSPGWSIGEPSGTTTLTWNDLTDVANGHPPGYIEGFSSDIYFTYKAVVGGTATSGDVLTNCVMTTTTTGEDTNYVNNAYEEVEVPYPDLSVVKSGPPISFPGDTISWEIQYANLANMPAQNCWLIETLPDWDMDGVANVTFASTTAGGPNPITIYYSSVTGPAPVFNPLAPSASWSLSPTVPVNHIAYSVGDLGGKSGPFSIYVNTILVDPVSQVEPFPGQQIRNDIEIHTLTPETNFSNNADDAETRIPGVDLAITKRASVEGAFPGTYPGSEYVYYLEFENSGTENAFGVHITDDFPALFVPDSPLDYYTFVDLVDASGNPVLMVDATDTPVTFPVPVTRQISGNTVTWHLGTTGSNLDADFYQNLALPPGARGVIEIRGQIDVAARDQDRLDNITYIAVDGPPGNTVPEEYLANNTDEVYVVVYRPELYVDKSVVDRDTGSSAFTDQGNVLCYEVEFNNVGNIDALDVVIRDTFPEGVTYIPGSMELPGGINPGDVTLSDDGFEINLVSVPAPACFDAEDLFCDPCPEPEESLGYWDFEGDLMDQGYGTNHLVDAGKVTGLKLCDDIERGSVLCVPVGGVAIANPANLPGWPTDTTPDTNWLGFTVDLMFKLDPIIMTGDPVDSYIIFSAGGITFRVHGGGRIANLIDVEGTNGVPAALTTLNAEQWYHAVFVYDLYQRAARVYIDCEFVGWVRIAASKSKKESESKEKLEQSESASSSSQIFLAAPGSYDNVRLHNRLYTVDEIPGICGCAMSGLAGGREHALVDTQVAECETVTLADSCISHYKLDRTNLPMTIWDETDSNYGWPAFTTALPCRIGCASYPVPYSVYYNDFFVGSAMSMGCKPGQSIVIIGEQQKSRSESLIGFAASEDASASAASEAPSGCGIYSYDGLNFQDGDDFSFSTWYQPEIATCWDATLRITNNTSVIYFGNKGKDRFSLNPGTCGVTTACSPCFNLTGNAWGGGAGDDEKVETELLNNIFTGADFVDFNVTDVGGGMYDVYLNVCGSRAVGCNPKVSGGEWISMWEDVNAQVTNQAYQSTNAVACTEKSGGIYLLCANPSSGEKGNTIFPTNCTTKLPPFCISICSNELTIGTNSMLLPAPFETDINWHHFAVSIEGSAGIPTVWIDGEPITWTGGAIDPINWDCYAQINYGAFEGAMDDIKLWKDVLSDDEVIRVMDRECYVFHREFGTFETTATVANIASWDQLQVDQTIPEGTRIEWEVLDGSTSLIGPTEFDNFLDISSIDAAITSLTLRAILYGDPSDRCKTPLIDAWRVTTKCLEGPTIKYCVTVDKSFPEEASCDLLNTVEIENTVPEIDDNYSNNVDDASITVQTTDLAVRKISDPSAIHTNDIFTYVIEWDVLGPQGALDMEITDFLPDGLTLISQSATPAALSNTVTNTSGGGTQIQWFFR